MSAGGLGPVPPIDPRQDEARRAAARHARGEGLLMVGLLFGQVGLASLLGSWAGSGFEDPGGQLAAFAAAGMVMALICAHVVAYWAGLLLGGVALLALLPRLFRRPAPRPERDRRISRTLRVALLLVHALFLLGAAGLLCLLLALSSDSATLGQAWWRFALAALALAPVTARLLRAWERSEGL